MLPGINQLLAILVVLLAFLPLVLYWRKKLSAEKSYLCIVIFWTINGILYFPEMFHWAWYKAVTNQITLYYNLIDPPLIVLTFYYIFKRKFFLNLLGAFLIFELVMVAWKGFNFDSNNYIIGVGSLISLIMNLWGISRYFMNVEHSQRENVLVFVYAGFIFYYGLFAVVFNYNYLHSSGAQMPYVILINYSAVILSTSLISFGFWKYATVRYSEDKY